MARLLVAPLVFNASVVTHTFAAEKTAEAEAAAYVNKIGGSITTKDIANGLIRVIMPTRAKMRPCRDEDLEHISLLPKIGILVVADTAITDDVTNSAASRIRLWRQSPP